jgi:hypothetical protein
MNYNNQPNHNGNYNAYRDQDSVPMITNSYEPIQNNPQNNQHNYQPPQQQSQPIITQTQPIIVHNQIVKPNELAGMQATLKSSPQFVSCPFCHHQGLTNTRTSCSVLNCLCCICATPLCWLLFQVIRGKDINCKDADHFCVRCGNKLSSYSAC